MVLSSGYVILSFSRRCFVVGELLVLQLRGVTFGFRTGPKKSARKSANFAENGSLKNLPISVRVFCRLARNGAAIGIHIHWSCITLS